MSSLALAIATEHDAIAARRAAKALADEVGFKGPDGVKIATVVSELARNVIRYAGKGLVELTALEQPRSGIEIVVTDEGPGIADLDLILSGAYKSRTGMGLGIVGSKRLVDELEIETAPGKGTRIVARKYGGRR